MYFFWGSDESAWTGDVASSFTGGQMALAGAGGAVLGLLIATLVFRSKRKGKAAQAANFQFITGIGLACGENAYEELEEAGYRVMSVGLNYGADDASSVYLGYRINEGAPVTNVVITSNVGDSIVSAEGISYVSAGGIDVDEGTGASGGVIYYTQDPAAGEPLVGLDILRQDTTDGKELLAIQNDGSEVVRNAEGIPADLEAGNEDVIIYLEQIRDHILCPFIREIEAVTEVDRQRAVFKAAMQGYNYFIDGDIDDNASAYTILAYRRTANPDEAITNIVGVSEALRKILEEKQVRPGSEDPKKDVDKDARKEAEESDAVRNETAAEVPAAMPEEAEAGLEVVRGGRLYIFPGGPGRRNGEPERRGGNPGTACLLWLQDHGGFRSGRH